MAISTRDLILAGKANVSPGRPLDYAMGMIPPAHWHRAPWKLDGQNVWPEGLDGFKEYVMEY